MKVTLSWSGSAYAALLKQIVGNDAAQGCAEAVELELEIFSEATAIIISQGLGVAEGLQHGVGLEKCVFYLVDVFSATAHSGDVALNLFGGFGLASARLA